jgi:hypothetical protein
VGSTIVSEFPAGSRSLNIGGTGSPPARDLRIDVDADGLQRGDGSRFD